MWWWLRRNWWNEVWQGTQKYREKTCPSPTLYITNPTWLDPCSNPDRRGGKPATNRLSYGAALCEISIWNRKWTRNEAIYLTSSSCSIFDITGTEQITATVGIPNLH
jgi:hypothetical protein